MATLKKEELMKTAACLQALALNTVEGIYMINQASLPKHGVGIARHTWL
jgi:hypothetical protein